MGEEMKENQAKKEEEKKEVKTEDKKEEPQEIVLKVDMHCEACARKVAKSLRGFEGVEEVTADYKASKVVVKGKTADPTKVSQRIQKKSGKKVEIISPLPNPPPQEDENKQQIKKDDDPPKEPNKDGPPPVVTVVLKVRMHCDACAQVLQKRVGKIQGVESVTTDIANDHVIVKGVLNPDKLVSDVYKKTGKQASIVKNEEKKEDEKKEEKEADKKQPEETKEDEDDDMKMDIKKIESWPSKYYLDHSYAPQMFSDENPNACSVM